MTAGRLLLPGFLVFSVQTLFKIVPRNLAVCLIFWPRIRPNGHVVWLSRVQYRAGKLFGDDNFALGCADDPKPGRRLKFAVQWAFILDPKVLTFIIPKHEDFVVRSSQEVN